MQRKYAEIMGLKMGWLGWALSLHGAIACPATSLIRSRIFGHPCHACSTFDHNLRHGILPEKAGSSKSRFIHICHSVRVKVGLLSGALNVLRLLIRGFEGAWVVLFLAPTVRDPS